MPSEPASAASARVRRPLRLPRVLPRPLARREADELLDQAGHDPAELAANLADIRRVNRLAGGTRATLRELPVLLDAVPTDRPATVLDLATGSGDIPRALIDRCRRQGRSVAVIASDVSPEILDEARRHLAGYPEVAFAEHDARAVALPDRGVDIVLCALALHHFRPHEAALVLREMARLARVGFVLNDITRSRAGYAAAWAASRVATRNRLTHHDMPLSVLRAYTPDEVRHLLATAGLSDATVHSRWLFRMSATWVAGH